MELLNVNYNEWLVNTKRLPDKESAEYADFYAFHKRLCTEGCNVGGVYFNPFLMWHLNVWNTSTSVRDDKGRISEKYMNPSFRDNEWIVTNEIDRAEREHKGVAIFGIRRFSKTTLEASYLSWGATFDENSQNIIAGLNSQDIKLVTDAIDKGLGFIPDAWKWQRIEDNWKSQVTLGIKTKANERIPFSQILIRNLDDGNNEEAIAGTKPRKLVIDEGGKGNFLKGLQAAIPGFTTPYGWGCSPIVSGTGGDMTKFRDAMELFFKVEAFNFLHYKNEDDERKVHGLFIGNKYRLEAKEESNFATFLGVESEELSQIPMAVSNPDKADQIQDDNLNRLKKSGDMVAYLKEKMYYPKKVDDIFLSLDTNIYNSILAKKQQVYIRENNITGSFVELYQDSDGVKHSFVTNPKKVPIPHYPHESFDFLNAPIQIWEFPPSNPPFGLYTCGVDSYRQANAADSDSLGAIYIFKRVHNIFDEKFKNMFVAAYVARPEDKMTFNEQARLLIKLYNARTLVENDEMSFIDYMISKGDERFLEPEPQYLKGLVKNSSVNRPYGIHRSAPAILDKLREEFKQYTEQVHYTEKAEDGSVLKEITGFQLINDPMLLEEMVKYYPDANVDRIVAAELAYSLGNYLNREGIINTTEEDPRITAYKNTHKKGRLFSPVGSLFSKPRKLFKH